MYFHDIKQVKRLHFIRTLFSILGCYKTDNSEVFLPSKDKISFSSITSLLRKCFKKEN